MHLNHYDLVSSKCSIVVVAGFIDVNAYTIPNGMNAIQANHLD